MKKLINRLAIAYPSGNTTAVVFDDIESVDTKELNDSILKTWKSQSKSLPEIEQCCFAQKPHDKRAAIRIEMFGGEFCGNASRSVVWLVNKGRNSQGFIESSGVGGLLSYQIKDGDVKLQMPLPSTLNLTEVVNEGTLVHLDGISHLVVTEHAADNPQSPRDLLTFLLKTNKYGLSARPAVGVSYFHPNTGKAEFCVWVNTIDTIFDETACGSGTSSIGIAIALKNQTSRSLPVRQPSGETIMAHTVVENGRILNSFIEGKVKIIYDGELKLS